MTDPVPRPFGLKEKNGENAANEIFERGSWR